MDPELKTAQEQFEDEMNDLAELEEDLTSEYDEEEYLDHVEQSREDGWAYPDVDRTE